MLIQSLIKHINISEKLHIDDYRLLENFYSDHDNKWLGILLPRYTLLLLGVCMKYLKNEEDAKDSVQQIFLKVINELPKYKVEYFKSWIYMVAKNHCLMKLRDKGKFDAEVDERILATMDDIDEKDKLIKKDNSLEALQEALYCLNKEQQLCINLFYLQKKSYTDIVKQTGFTLMQVKSHIQNGKRNLRILLSDKLKKVDE